ncbi:hypothetical protein E4H12_02785 [Candidatus Thorarchaeota archaeon]|nr:MAG: hypothetical protein E4H12_02785 [Candidatus Thorarchaeota archaeon]
MKIEYCLRCNSTKLEEGVIYEYTPQHFVEPIRVHWKVALHIRADSAPIKAIVCKSCGHIELVIHDYAKIDPHQYQCPHCRATYYYHLDAESDTHSVKCQNCGKKFEIQEEDSRDIVDVIEDELQEE